MSFAKASSLESQPPSQSSRASGTYSDDPEFQSLSVSLSEKLFSLTSNTSQLSRQISLIGTKRETERVRERIQSIIEESSDGFKDVGEGLKKLANWHEPLGAHQKYTLNKLNTDFRSGLGEFQVLQQTALSKQREARTALESGNAGESGQAGGQQQQQQLLQLEEEGRLADQSEVDFQQSLIIERESEIRQIEQSVGELNELFRDVATMVTDQGVVLDTIAGNIENTRDDTRGADTELHKASNYQKSARGKACCLLLILAVVLIVVILAVTVG